MAQIIEIAPDTRVWLRNFEREPDSDDQDIWPEVSTRYSRENPVPENPQNAQGRVMFEVALTLAIVGILASPTAFLAAALS